MTRSPRQSTKTQRNGKTKLAGAKMTTARPWEAPQTMVVATAVGEPFSPAAPLSLLQLFGSQQCCAFCY